MKKWEIGLVITLSVLISYLFYFPIINSGDNLGIEDWDQNLAWTESTRVTLLEYHQFPVWNPYKCGGVVQFGNPQVPVISVQTVFALIFGTLKGIKLSIFFHGALGLIGFYLLAKQYRLSKLGSLLAAIIFSFSGITGSFLSTGMVVFTPFAYAPFILLFFNKSLQNWKWGVACGALFAFTFYYGYQIPLVLGVYIFVYTLVKCIFNRTLVPLKAAIIMVACATLLMLPKLYLSIQLMRIIPRTTNDVSGYSLQNFFYFLLSQKQNLFDQYMIKGSNFNIDENSLYIGLLPVVLFLIFFVRNKDGIRKNLPLLCSLLIIFWVMLGNVNSPSLYKIMSYLPIISSFRVAQRFRFDFIIPFALIAGLGFDNAFRQLQKYKLAQPLSILCLLIVYVDLTVFSSSNFLSKTLIIKNPEVSLSRQATFVQSDLSGLEVPIQRTIQIPEQFLSIKRFKPFSFEYLKIKQNKGELECYDPLYEPVTDYVFPTGIEGEEGHPEYQGEFYLLNPVQGVKVENTFWSPNKLVYTISNIQQASDDTLIINQNYYPGWIVRTGSTSCQRVMDYEGLIATRLDATSSRVTLEFNPLLLYLRCAH